MADGTTLRAFVALGVVSCSQGDLPVLTMSWRALFSDGLHILFDSSMELEKIKNCLHIIFAAPVTVESCRRLEASITTGDHGLTSAM